MTLCACGCGRYAPYTFSARDDSGGYWRADCTPRVLTLLRQFQNLPAPALALIISVLRENGEDETANVLVGCIPFEVTR